MDRAYSARFDGIAICSGSKPNRLYGSGRVGRIANLVQIGSKVRRRRRADITIAVGEVATGWFADFGPMENLLIPSQDRRAGRVIRFSSLCYGWWTMPSSSRVSARKMSNL